MDTSNNTTEGKRVILVVEDERPLQEAIGDKLKRSGFEVVTATTCEQALGYVHDLKQVDAVWLDHYLLGKATGLDFVAHMKEHDENRDIPIFVVSNTGTHDKKQTYLRLGAVKYYIKSDHRLDGIIQDIHDYLTGDAE